MTRGHGAAASSQVNIFDLGLAPPKVRSHDPRSRDMTPGQEIRPAAKILDLGSKCCPEVTGDDLGFITLTHILQPRNGAETASSAWLASRHRHRQGQMDEHRWTIAETDKQTDRQTHETDTYVLAYSTNKPYKQCTIYNIADNHWFGTTCTNCGGRCVPLALGARRRLRDSRHGRCCESPPHRRGRRGRGRGGRPLSYRFLRSRARPRERLARRTR